MPFIAPFLDPLLELLEAWLEAMRPVMFKIGQTMCGLKSFATHCSDGFMWTPVKLQLTHL